LRGDGAVGVAALRRLLAEGAVVAVDAPAGSAIAEIARAAGVHVEAASAALFDDVIDSAGPWPVG
jgi:hypothetical protein